MDDQVRHNCVYLLDVETKAEDRTHAGLINHIIAQLYPVGKALGQPQPSRWRLQHSPRMTSLSELAHVLSDKLASVANLRAKVIALGLNYHTVA